ncbi:Flp pilus assembly protein CpaB [Limimaricola pyoseonensis]|uniref:Pilus assembly protein CpaB n=1 Tax=Limimaricola pyoseonensis TaxID=521013 RepID=A0A1G7DBD2_9RHOB|nr:Flp pilus assembly protein CpaB [Limimaricola pyoseonensis]SDE48914.1 pilus assembly protein CpaB [Limimaricola pyoseonensis]
MRAVFAFVFLIGLGLAGFAVYMVQGHFEQQQAALARERAVAKQQVPTVEVLAVSRALSYGEELTPEDVAPIRYVEKHLPEGTVSSLEELFPADRKGARLVLRPMEANEPVLLAKITAPGGNAGISTRLDQGMRAFAISVTAASGVSGFLRPGDRVDVYWTGSLNVGPETGQEVTKLIETGLELVGVDQTSDQSRAEAMVARTVTVQASPQQVANLAQAQSTGTLALSLVGMGDQSVAGAVEVDQRSLLGIVEEEKVAEVAPAPAPEPQVCTIRTRRGAEVVEIPIPCTN